MFVLNLALKTIISLVVALQVAYAGSVYELKGYTLRYQLSPALCNLEAERSEWRQCKEGYSINILGLRPDVARVSSKESLNTPTVTIKRKFAKSIGKRACSKEDVRLSPLQARVLNRMMPDSILRKVSWRGYGACMNMDAKTYFQKIYSLASQFNTPNEVRSGNDYEISKDKLVAAFIANNAELPKSSIQLACMPTQKNKTFVLTEFQVCYDTADNFTECQKKVEKVCPERFQIVGLP